MKITILSQEYAPEEVSTAIVVQELAEDLASRGHQVSVVTRAPNYPLGKVFDGFRNLIYQNEMRNGVKVHRVWSYISPNKGFWHRIFGFGSFSACAIYGGLIARKSDLLVCYSPPLPLGISGWLLHVFWHVPWVFRVEDLYPEAAQAAGVLTNRHVIRFFERMALFLYRHSDQISVITGGFERRLLSKDIPADKVTINPCWADPDFVTPQPKENAFRLAQGITNKFVVMYAGALGLTSALEDVLAAAKILKDLDDVRFVIVGEGAKKKWIIQTVDENGLNNVILVPFQPRNEFPQMLAAADVNMVTLNREFADFSLPHKIFNIMASERPILGVAPQECDLAKLICENDCGVVVVPGQVSNLADAILKIKADPLRMEEMGHKGRALLLSSFSRKIIIDGYENTFLQTVKKWKNNRKGKTR